MKDIRKSSFYLKNFKKPENKGIILGVDEIEVDEYTLDYVVK